MHTYCSLLLDSNMMSAGLTVMGICSDRLPAFKTSRHDLDKTQVCASHITRPSNDIIVLCCSVGTRLYFTIISHCGLSDPPGWLMPSYAFKRLQTRVTKRSTKNWLPHYEKKEKKEKRISETIMHTANSRTLQEIILMLLFCSLSPLDRY